VDHLLLTHAHIDHSGLIPRLCRLGFTGSIHTTAATADLCEPLLLDSGKIQEEDAVWELRKWRKGQQNTPPPAPLYVPEDAQRALKQFAPCDYDETVPICEGVSARWVDAGHILGAASIEVWMEEGGQKRKIVFSGDIGNPGRPILRDPSYIAQSDFVVMESTYGDRAHPAEEEVSAKLADAVNMALRARGHLIVPAFAVGRTQELLYRMDRLLAAGAIPSLKVYVDSPLASKATAVFRNHSECYDEAMRAQLDAGDDPLQFASLHFTESADESRRLNDIRESIMIISASGMCTAGRIRHHLHHHIEHGGDVVLFTGFQAGGTLGRKLVEGAKEITLFGRRHRVRARIVSIRGLSAHADQAGLLRWSDAIQGPELIFVTHGEEPASLKFASLLKERGRPAAVPHIGQSVDLLDGTTIADCIAQTDDELQQSDQVLAQKPMQAEADEA
jgi:metallo-beta-lactamase family protein